MLKRKLKRALEHVAAKVGKHQRKFEKPVLLILGYHRILPENHPEYHLMQPGMRVRPEILAMHIRVLRQYFEFVDLNEWVKKARVGEAMANKSVALTFDDGWVDNYEYAYPILKQEEVPATVFLVSSMIDTSKQFWPERVGSILDYIKKSGSNICNVEQVSWLKQHGFDPNDSTLFNEEDINRLISHLKKHSDEKICKNLLIFSNIESLLTYPVQMLNKAQLLEMKASGFVTYGAHTRNHYRLDKMASRESLKEEVLGCKIELEALLDVNISGFCYPNGNFDETSVDVVGSEYQYSCTTQKGWNTVETNTLLLNRILLHDDVSCDEVSFKAKISGLL